MTLRLDHEQLEDLAERVAVRVAAMLAPGPPARSRLVDAAAVATHLGVERDWVYRNAARLGARRVGEGARPRLRFDLEEVDRRLVACSDGRGPDEGADGVVEPIRPRRRRRRSGTDARLLPIREARGG